MIDKQIDWDSHRNEILINPRFPAEEGHKLLELLNDAPKLSGHIWLATSGSSGHFKWVALSKQAILVSAQSVNQHLKSDKNDVWLHCLPDFHVGGVGIWARSYLSKSKVIVLKEKWEPQLFYQSLMKSKASLTSLVPAQVYDLVIQKIYCPEYVRAVIVGGGKLSEKLYAQARELGWPLMPSYGLTECASQVATAHLNSPDLHILGHVECRIEPDQTIAIKSAALLSLYGYWKQEKAFFEDPKKEGWFITEDRGELEKGVLRMLGRASQFVKVGGESVDLGRLEKILEQVKMEKQSPHDVAIIALPDERLGHSIHLCAAINSTQEIQDVLDGFQSRVLPYERIKRVHVLPYIPRTSLQKIAKVELLNMLEAK